MSTKQPMPYGRNGICLLWQRSENDCNYSLLINFSVEELVRKPTNGSKCCSTEGSHNTRLQGTCSGNAEHPPVTTSRCFPHPSRATSIKSVNVICVKTPQTQLPMYPNKREHLPQHPALVQRKPIFPHTSRSREEQFPPLEIILTFNLPAPHSIIHIPDASHNTEQQLGPITSLCMGTQPAEPPAIPSQQGFVV